MKMKTKAAAIINQIRPELFSPLAEQMNHLTAIIQDIGAANKRFTFSKNLASGFSGNELAQLEPSVRSDLVVFEENKVQLTGMFHNLEEQLQLFDQLIQQLSVASYHNKTEETAKHLNLIKAMQLRQEIRIKLEEAQSLLHECPDFSELVHIQFLEIASEFESLLCKQ